MLKVPLKSNILFRSFNNYELHQSLGQFGIKLDSLEYLSRIGNRLANAISTFSKTSGQYLEMGIEICAK